MCHHNPGRWGEGNTALLHSSIRVISALVTHRPLNQLENEVHETYSEKMVKKAYTGNYSTTNQTAGKQGLVTEAIHDMEGRLGKIDEILSSLEEKLSLVLSGQAISEGKSGPTPIPESRLVGALSAANDQLSVIGFRIQSLIDRVTL